MQLLVYTPVLAPRVEYIFSTLLSALGVNNYEFTVDPLLFKETAKPQINYSPEKIADDEFWIKPVDLLFESGIKEQATDFFEWNETKAFFQRNNSDFGFDIFAASFYLISRYEEYLPYLPDTYGRYGHTNSVAFKNGFLQLPLINVWLQQLKEELLRKFPFLHFMPQNFHFLPTYDIDIAWSYLNKGWLRNIGGLLTSIIENEWTAANERINVLFGKHKDPFDSYEWLDRLHDENQLQPLYFFLLAQQNKDYDKNILPAKTALTRLIKKHFFKYSIAIHPSWQSGDQHELLKKEIETLTKITGHEVRKSRQHYIRMRLPETYRRLIDAGITEDYSMGYGSINGFRASYCLPYKWFDLQREKTTALTVYPFCFMDANAYYEQHQTCGEALDEIYHYYQITKKVNGLLIMIWHNHFLGSDKMFKGWKEVYQTAISKMKTSLESKQNF